MPNFTFYKQLNAMDCGPTCLRMVVKYYGGYNNTDSIREVAGFSKEGVSLLGMSVAAENIGFHSRGVQLSFNQLQNDVRLPCILHWRQNHFVVLVTFKTVGIFHRNPTIVIADPAEGIINYTRKEFL